MSGLKSLKKRRRVQIIVLAFVALALSTGLIGFAMRDGINLFRSPTQVLETPPGETEVFRIGGLVAIDSLVRGEGETITFVVTDGTSEVPVRYTGILPDLFDEGQGMVGQGRYVPLCDHAGNLINDPVLLKLEENRFWLSIADSDIALWASAIAAEWGLDVQVFEPDVSPLAVQGPKAEAVIASLFGDWVRERLDPKFLE